MITAYDANINMDRGADSMRTIIDLPETDRERLDSLCRQRGLSRAEGLRQALRSWLDHQGVQHQS
ncbi:MAG: ribbon-helix-helix domain-containing protein, partial [Cyanobium sp. MAG_137]|nr:ribbon-helix-helix domain-containing protein [Cyanobium sp. MAG_137]